MIKLNERYYIKIVPHRGDIVHKFELTRRHIVVACIALAIVIAGSLAFGGIQAWRAHAQVAQLQSLTSQQKLKLMTIDKQTEAIRAQLQRVQKQNQEIQQLIGVKPRVQKTSEVRHSIDALAAATQQTTEQSNLLRRLTMRVLNVRHIQALARAKAIAAIPSIDPVAGAQVVGCFCYRTSPDTEFHPGVDLGADYGEVVR